MLLAISAHEPPQTLGLEMASASPGALESLLAYWIRPYLIFYLFIFLVSIQKIISVPCVYHSPPPFLVHCAPCLMIHTSNKDSNLFPQRCLVNATV